MLKALNNLKRKFRTPGNTSIKPSDVIQLAHSPNTQLMNTTNQVSADSHDVTALLALSFRQMVRTLGITPYQSQLQGAIALINGTLAEMETGEGKTASCALAAAVLALQGRKVHVATVNDYLAKRDAGYLKPFYEALGLTVDHATESNPGKKTDIYASNIVYSTAQGLGFDYLRDHLVESSGQVAQGRHDVLLLDEVDSLLIDESGTPLVLTSQAGKEGQLYGTMMHLCTDHTSIEHVDIDHEERVLAINDKGYEVIESKLKEYRAIPHESNLQEKRYLPVQQALVSCLTALYLYKRDVHYIVQGKEIAIIDENTGRILAGRRWSEGLHQAVEAKEGLTVKSDAPTLGSITYKAYIQLYQHVAGLSGTVAGIEEEVKEEYGLDVEVIPPHKASLRVDHQDRLYKTHEERVHAVVAMAIQAHGAGQPVLIGVDSIESAREYSAALTAGNLAQNVLDALSAEREAEIISDAGRAGAITVATQVAGRGTDILLGGNLDAVLQSIDSSRHAAVTEDWISANEKILSVGGLLVIGTFRGASRRVDRQLQGRAGRQGAPGESIFLLSSEDEILQTFAKAGLDQIMQSVELEKGEYIQSRWMDKVISRAQMRKESLERNVRKEATRYDGVSTEQRVVFYSIRKQWRMSLEGTPDIDFRNSLIANALNASVDSIFRDATDTVNAEELQLLLADRWNLQIEKEPLNETVIGSGSSLDTVKNALADLAENYLEFRKSRIGHTRWDRFVHVSMLEGLDHAWKLHNERMKSVRDGIELRAYANENPLFAYQKMAIESFNSLMDDAYSKAGNTLLGAYIPELAS